jgi:hypothetical protein
MPKTTRSARRILSPALLLAVLGCFFLPFATVSCDGEQVTPTGMQLVVGDAPASQLVGPDRYDGSLGEDVIDETQGFAITAFAGVVLALGCAVVLKPPSRAAFLFSELGFLGFMWISTAGAVTDADVTFRAGFWLGLLGLVASMAVHARAMRRRGLWACVVAGIPGMLHPLALAVVGSIVGVIYVVVWANRRLPAPSQELRPPSAVQTTGKNESSIEVSPTRL